MTRLSHVLLASALLVATPALAQRGPRAAPPTVAEIAAAVPRLVIDTARVVAHKRESGAMVGFAPARLDDVAGVPALEAGRLIGVLWNDEAGPRTQLPKGTYELYAARIGDRWHVWAHADGRIVGEAVDVALAPADKQPANAVQDANGFAVTFALPGCWPALPRTMLLGVDQRALRARERVTIREGSAKQFTARVFSDCGDAMGGRQLDWRAGNDDVVRVDGNTGVVMALAPGFTMLTVVDAAAALTASTSIGVTAMRPNAEMGSVGDGESGAGMGGAAPTLSPLPRQTLRFTF